MTTLAQIEFLQALTAISYSEPMAIHKNLVKLYKLFAEEEGLPVLDNPNELIKLLEEGKVLPTVIKHVFSTQDVMDRVAAMGIYCLTLTDCCEVLAMVDKGVDSNMGMSWESLSVGIEMRMQATDRFIPDGTEEFDEKQYPYRYITIGKTDYKISTDELGKALFENNGGEYVNEEAEDIDNCIGYYIPLEEIYKSDKSIADYILENIDSSAGTKTTVQDDDEEDEELDLSQNYLPAKIGDKITFEDGELLAFLIKMERYCTSDLKRLPSNQFFQSCGHNLIISCEGISAEESNARALKNPLTVRDCSSSYYKEKVTYTTKKGETKTKMAAKSVEWCIANYREDKRMVLTWYPIFNFTIEEVWATYGMDEDKLFIARNFYIRKKHVTKAWAFHPAYVMGNNRVSCMFCILGSINDLQNAAKQNPELLHQMIAMEQEGKATFKHNWSLKNLIK